MNYIKRHNKLLVFLLLLVCSNTNVFSEIVGVFYDSSNEQIKFAAGDVKTALESKGNTVEMLALSTLNTAYANKKVVIALVDNVDVSAIFSSQGGVAPTGLGQQAYGLITTTTPQKSFWVFGGDANGAMYGALQVAENIQTDNLVGTYDEKVSPDFIQRGVKLNLPLDKRIPTYSGYMNPTSTQHAIANVWDMNFWKTWIDQQARNRYNVLSVWVHHPFPALVKVPGYELASLPGIEGYFGFSAPNLTHENRVAFWRQVMTYAHSRGFQFYFFCWNVTVDYAKDQYPAITDVETNTTTIDYLSKSMKALLETYPELDGFGISAGDNMDSPKDDRPAWTWKAYGKAAYDYAIANPERKFTIIHRGLGTALTSVYKDWSPLTKLPNFKFDYSVKYANAHMFSTLTPKWYDSDMADAASFNQKTWLTLRNDDYFYMDMGDPEFVRGFLKSVPYRQVINSFYMGSDLYMPSRTFFCKDGKMNGQLEIERNWYIQMLWGRIAYNKQTPDAVFKNEMAKRFPQAPSETLFNAWALAARPLPKVQELTQGTWGLDAHWYAEASGYPCNGNSCFRYLNDFLTTDIARSSSSNLCNIPNSAAGTCGTSKSTYQLADEMEADALAALNLINTVTSQGDEYLQMKINNIKQLAFLSNHFAYKIRAATYLKANQLTNARDAMGKAYCWWMQYTNSMDAMYNGNRFRTVDISPNWHFVDAFQLKDYTDLGGVGIPTCETVPYNISVASSDENQGSVTGGGQFNSGSTVTVTASSKPGFRFANWKVNGLSVSTDSVYSFVVIADRHLVASFIDKSKCDIPWSTADVTVNNTIITNRSMGLIYTACSPNVIITADIEGFGGLDATDYCQLSYKINGGTAAIFIDINNLKGAFAKKSFSKSVDANSVELILNSKNTSSDEIYKISNIKIVSTLTAIDNVMMNANLNGIKIHPNPAKDLVSFSEVIDAEFYNVSGQQVLTVKNSSKADISSLSKGFYQVRINKGLSFKLVVN